MSISGEAMLAKRTACMEKMVCKIQRSGGEEDQSISRFFLTRETCIHETKACARIGCPIEQAAMVELLSRGAELRSRLEIMKGCRNLGAYEITTGIMKAARIIRRTMSRTPVVMKTGMSDSGYREET